jgi:hypothetical protein
MAAYQFSDATLSLLRQRWQFGATEVAQNFGTSHVGQAKPFVRAWIRTGKVIRRMQTNIESYSKIPGSGNKVWQGRWKAAGMYRDLPNVQEVELTTDFGQNGVTQATITIDNIGVIETSGVAGIYHQMQRGYYAPLRGYRSPKVSQAVGTQNEWFDMLRDKSSEITIVAGYGEDTAIPVFKGLINDVDLNSNPDTIQIIARDFGQLLTDQQCFMNAIYRGMRDPITFADRLRTDNTEKIRGGVDASSSEPGHGARFAVDNNKGTYWLSQGNTDRNAVEHITMTIPNGRYESIKLAAQHPGMEAYIAVKAKDKNAPGHKGARRGLGGPNLPDDEWVDEGKGNVPGTSIPYVKHIGRVKEKESGYSLPEGGYILGDNSKIRVFFTRLAPTYKPPNRVKRYRASVSEFSAIKRKLPKDIVREEWILVDDVSDIVRTVLQWCGLDTEWEVEDTGVRLKDKIVFNRQNKLIDIINKIAEMTGYIFYMKPPSLFDGDDLTKTNEDNQSMGIPVFRQNQAMRRPGQSVEPVESISEDSLIESLQATFTDEPLAYNIRVRGKRLGKKKAAKIGRSLSGDRTKRPMYVYRPPWSRDQSPGGNWPASDRDEYRNGNIKKFVVHHNELLSDGEECEIAALFIAFREALESAKATCEAPAMPSVHLDHQFAVRDTGTGIAARIWITNRTLSIRTGEDAHFKMGLGGSILDTPDIITVRKELKKALNKKGYDPGLSEWELEHWGDVYHKDDL